MRGYPLVKAVPKELKKHGHVRIDSYYWLREREDPEVMDYLKRENEYMRAVMAHTEALEKTLFQEIKGRIKQTDMSVPYRLDDYFYYTRYEEGKEYPIYARKKESLDAPEEMMINANVLAEGHEFFSVDTRTVSFGQDLLAYAVDTKGRRIYTIHFKNLNTGELLKDIITDVTGNMDWANDNKTLFYSKQDLTTLRSYQIYRHVLGTESSEDQLVYEETDDTFSIFVFKTKSKKYMMIVSTQTLSHEYRYLDANDPNGDFRVFLTREREHEYQIDHFQDKFFIRTNDQAKNFRLMATPIEKTEKEHWQQVIPHRNDVFLENFEIFKDHLVLEERKGGLIHIRVIPWAGSGEHSLEFDEPAYHAHISINLEFDTPILRFGYTSMTTPNSIYDYNMVTRDRVLLKQEEILGGFDSQNYITERLHAPAEDGTEIPISIVYRKGFKKDGQRPLVLYGYGSYGLSMDASFNSPRLSLIDRGFTFAIAHIRGGEEFGRQWYEDGRLLKKKNSFTDFIACGDYLVREGYTSREKMYAMGGSAGGLLMGAVINMRHDLFKGVVAQVPFVDVITTMLDETIPLTTSEYDEWGDPNKKEYYDYMLSYSPYDNVEAKHYPHLLVTTGLNDSQVQYWEPAKWVAKLRAMKTDQNRLLLKTNMDAGHGGASGRFKRFGEIAFHYTFILDLAGIKG
ncbi:MAG: S9 family peptidase [Deltaproteobacteria bacterium]|nr:S9 family peptidase [Deltaproteobacteria bacterium]